MCVIIKQARRYIVMSEHWKWIIYNGHDFTGKYMVSNYGRIRSVDRFTEKQHQFFKGKIISQRDSSKSHVRSKTKYKTVTLYDNGKSIDIEVHRLVATAFIGNPDNKKCVNHKDGNGSNNSVENLEWCTYSENVHHSMDVLGHDPRKWKSKPTPIRSLISIKVRARSFQESLQTGMMKPSPSMMNQGIHWSLPEKRSPRSDWL